MSHHLMEALRANDLPHSLFPASEIIEVHVDRKLMSAWVLGQRSASDMKH